MGSEVVEAVSASEPAAATRLFTDAVASGESPWEVHLELFPPAQRVLNPPFINPHFPKLYAVVRELAPELERRELAGLVRLEVGEFALRPKLPLPEKPEPAADASFGDFVAAVARRAEGEAAEVLLALWQRERGRLEVARGLLLLGAGYLRETLGHSVSCTAFILLELLRRPEEDPWPALVALADYCCRGGFEAAPGGGRVRAGTEASRDDVLRAVSGGGLVALHHTITFYAVERVRALLEEEEHRRLLAAWTAFLGETRARPVRLGKGPAAPDVDAALRTFEPARVASACGELLRTPQGRTTLLRRFVRFLGESYRGKANPHHVTGLGATLWSPGAVGRRPRDRRDRLPPVPRVPPAGGEEGAGAGVGLWGWR